MAAENVSELQTIHHNKSQLSGFRRTQILSLKKTIKIRTRMRPDYKSFLNKHLSFRFLFHNFDSTLLKIRAKSYQNGIKKSLQHIKFHHFQHKKNYSCKLKAFNILKTLKSIILLNFHLSTCFDS